MSSEYIEISIVRAEGLSIQSQSIGCYVQIDGRLHDVITPLNVDNQENEVLVPNSGLLRLIVKNMGCAVEVLGSVSFELKLLPTEGFQWLPLFTNMAKDQIHELPEEIDKFKILILINPNKAENALKEEAGLENKSNPTIFISELQEYLHKEKDRHELEVTRIEKQYKGLIESLTTDKEKYKKNCRKYQLIYDDISKELKSSKILLTEERKIRIDIQEKMGKVAQEYEENLKRANIREDSLLKMLEDKDQEISRLNSMISQQKALIRNLECEKQQIVDVVDEYKTELTLSNITKLNQELILVKGLLEESEAQRHKLQNFIQEIPETPCLLSSFMSPMSLGSSIEPEVSEEILENKQVDFYLDQFMKKYEGLTYQKIKDNSFIIGDKEVSLILKDGMLMAKNSLGLIPIQDVVQNDGYKTHRRGITVGCTKVTNENEEIVTVRGLKSPPDASFFQNCSITSKNSVTQASTPLRERNSNKRISKKMPFRWV